MISGRNWVLYNACRLNILISGSISSLTERCDYHGLKFQWCLLGISQTIKCGIIGTLDLIRRNYFVIRKN
jgi:hypothetical protein